MRKAEAARAAAEEEPARRQVPCSFHLKLDGPSCGLLVVYSISLTACLND